MNLLSSRTFLAFAVLMLMACVSPRGQREVYAGASASTDPNEMRLRSAEEQLAGGDLDDARLELKQVPESQLSELQRAYRQILQAELALAEGRPLIALQTLPKPGTLRDPSLALRAEEDRAQALFRIGDTVGAVQVLLQREKLLSDPVQRVANDELLWNGLRQTDLDGASGLRLQQADAVTRGWIELALISRAVWTPPQNLTNRLDEWRTQYPRHPATGRIAGITAAQNAPRKQLQNVALLLPLSGPFAGTGEAVRDGFFSAYFQSPQSPLTARIYDTGTTPESLRSAYRSALNEGAEFLIGPLRREDVVALAADGRPPVPVLALNYLDAGATPPFNFFQWGLAPEDEARQAAERAMAGGQTRAVTLAPEGDWGLRVQRAFRERLEALGGTVIGERIYAGDARDHSESIRALLALDMSEERHRALTTTLGVKTKFEPRRRQDVGLVFIAARPDQARLLGSQLRFHRSGALPVYATASIYEGEAPAMDLNGLRFCDMPWMLAQADDAANGWTALRTQLQTLFPARSREYTRLLALGYDAYTLVSLIENGQLQPGSFFPAATGTLTLRADGVISRGLSCVEIDRGTLKPLDLAGPELR